MNDRLIKLASTINAQVGGTVVYPASEIPKIFRIRLGIPAIDYCTTGGIPVNRIIELYGAESSGKTYTATIAMREFQNTCWATKTRNALNKVLTYKEKKASSKLKDGTMTETVMYVPDKLDYNTPKPPKLKTCVIIDVEGTFDDDWAAHLGVDTKRVIRVVPKTGEEAINIAEVFLCDPDVCLVVFDSVGVTKAAAEIDKPMEEQTMGVHARFWNRAVTKFQAALNKNPETDTTLILINRSYQKVGMVFGSPTEVGGGSGIRFAKSISLEYTPKKIITGDTETETGIAIGRNIHVANKKNKTGVPLRQADYFFCMCEDTERNLNVGDTDVPNDLLELGTQIGLIEKNGQTYTFGRKAIRGRDNFLAELRTNKVFLKSVMNKFYELAEKR